MGSRTKAMSSFEYVASGGISCMSMKAMSGEGMMLT